MLANNLTREKTMEEQLLTRRDVAEILGFQPQTLARWAWMKKGPPFVKIGPKAVRYRASEVRAWVIEQAAARGEDVSMWQQ